MFKPRDTVLITDNTKALTPSTLFLQNKECRIIRELSSTEFEVEYLDPSGLKIKAYIFQDQIDKLVQRKQKWKEVADNWQRYLWSKK